MTTTNDTPEQTTFRDLLSASDFATLDPFRLDTYGDGIEAIENGETIPYSYLNASSGADADAVGHRSLCGSDYSGGSLVRSNLKAFRALVEAETADGDPLPIVDTYGGYGTDGVLLLLDRKADADKLRPFVELLRALEDYPVVCEDTMSELEMDDENEAWDNGAEAEFAQALAGKIDHDYVEIEDPDTDHGPSLRELFTSIADSANLNGGPGVIHEETGPYFLIDDAAKAVSPVLLFALGFVKLDADTALEQAASTDTGDHEEARRVLRLSRLGRGLAAIQRQLASAFYSASIERAKDRVVPIVPLSKEANESHRSEADRKAADIILRADIDAGDEDVGLDADLPKALRIATVTLDRFIWLTKAHAHPTVTLDVDPDAPYSVDFEAIRAFVQD